MWATGLRRRGQGHTGRGLRRWSRGYRCSQASPQPWGLRGAGRLASRASRAPHTWISLCGLQNCEESNFCHRKSPRWWSPVMQLQDTPMAVVERLLWAGLARLFKCTTVPGAQNTYHIEEHCPHVICQGPPGPSSDSKAAGSTCSSFPRSRWFFRGSGLVWL